MCSCNDGRLLLALLFLLNGTGLIFDSVPFSALFTARYVACFKLFNEAWGLPMLSPEMITQYSVALVFLLESVMIAGATLTLAHQLKGPRVLIGVMLLLITSAVVEGLWYEALQDLAVIGCLLLLDPQLESDPPKKPAAPVLLPRPVLGRQKAE